MCCSTIPTGSLSKEEELHWMEGTGETRCCGLFFDYCDQQYIGKKKSPLPNSVSRTSSSSTLELLYGNFAI